MVLEGQRTAIRVRGRKSLRGGIDCRCMLEEGGKVGNWRCRARVARLKDFNFQAHLVSGLPWDLRL